jgi:hypothetical protein
MYMYRVRESRELYDPEKEEIQLTYVEAPRCMYMRRGQVLIGMV